MLPPTSLFTKVFLTLLAALTAGCDGDVDVLAASGGATGSSGPGGGSGGPGGGGPACVPGETAACYSGPAETEGEGICKGGVTTCAADGSGWGPCVGEVTPQAEDCATDTDEDCSGDGGLCPGLIWADRFGGTDVQSGQAIDLDATGDVVVAGSFVGTLDFGGGPLTSSGVKSDLFLARFDPKGQPVWSKSFSAGDAQERGTSVAFDPAGAVLFAGTSKDVLDFGGGPRCTAGFNQTFLAKLGPQGEHLWSRCFGGGNGATANLALVAADPAGDVILAGAFYSSIDFGAGTLSDLDGPLLVAKYDPAGNALWTRNFGGPDADARAWALAVDADGDLVVSGTFNGTLALAGHSFAGVAGETNAFVAKLDPNGEPVWARALASPKGATVRGVAVGADQRILVTGSRLERVDFGDGPVASLGPKDTIVVAFDSDGNHLWSRDLGGDAPSMAVSGRAVARSTDGIIFVLADKVVSPNPFAHELTLARFDLSGDLLMEVSYGSATGHSMVAEGERLAFTGASDGALNFGEPLETNGYNDVFIAVLVP